MASFTEQIKWLEDKLEHLDNAVDNETDKVVKSFLQDERNMIFTIIHEYKKAEKDSVSLGWIEYPDRMGR